MAKLNTTLHKACDFLKKKDFAACVIPSADPHLSEYVAPPFKFIEEVSGFTGSAGTLVLTAEGKGFLWTDSRYWEQAENQLKGKPIALMKFGDPATPSIPEFLQEKLPEGSEVALDYSLFDIGQIESWSTALKSKKMDLEDVSLIREIWKNRPKQEFQPIYEHLLSPRFRSDNLWEVQKALASQEADYLLVSGLDQIAWLFNLRGNDIPHNPVFYAYAIIPQASDEAPVLFVHLKSLPGELKKKLEGEGIVIKDYGDFEEYWKGLGTTKARFKVLLDPASTNARLSLGLPKNKKVLGESPIELMKSVKNRAEIELIRQAHLKDGIAMVKFLCWLDSVKDSGKETEISIAGKLLEFRKAQKGFKDVSFETICAFGPNAALPHYTATPEHNSQVKGNGFLLIDSGAQFEEGTTDITRTILVGEPTSEMIQDYTAVLKAHVRLIKTIFPEGISSQVLDTISRVPLWNIFADYGHGTGHGVGFFLNVHEGPQRISMPRISPGKDAVVKSNTAMVAGVVLSNEPGLYRKNKWGIRIENLITPFLTGGSEFGRFLRFETLTLCPLDLSCVDWDSLQPEEKKWINWYHEKVRRALTPHLKDDPVTAEWLHKKTRLYYGKQ